MAASTLEAIEMFVEERPRSVNELAVLLSVLPSDVRYCVHHSCRLKLLGNQVVLDDMVYDKDYGLVYRKEAGMLRRYKVPTLRELAQRRAQIRKHTRKNAPYRLMTLARLIQERLK